MKDVAAAALLVAETSQIQIIYERPFWNFPLHEISTVLTNVAKECMLSHQRHFFIHKLLGKGH
jgi:hypothetical protein